MGGVPVSRGFLELEWTNYPLAEELDYHQKKAKINPLEMDLFSSKINPLERIYLFWDTKSEIDFSSLIIQKIAD